MKIVAFTETCHVPAKSERAEKCQEEREKKRLELAGRREKEK